MDLVDVELVAVAAEEKPVLANLLQLYLHDYSEPEPRELSAAGTFDFPWLDSYFTGADREAYVIRVGGQPAGFALTRCDAAGDEGAWNVSEFFVGRAHRNSGVARAAARLLFQQHPGPWTFACLQHNAPMARLASVLAASVATGPVRRSSSLHGRSRRPSTACASRCPPGRRLRSAAAVSGAIRCVDA
ncbi:GNAT family N-acetyltransferase [Kitasatospora sp. GAS1066B]|uniref:GNAT family N-acetyltransferase n=1 Tax=Kitasatospora sp. GAS1066B TaxID=3156271 RepID=UPI003513D7DD